jgi:hypothetical protein
MRDENAQALLTRVMDWKTEAPVMEYVPILQLLADFKYDHYQRFGPGKRFIENLALWLKQFALVDRSEALKFVIDRLIFLSEREMLHIVDMAYADHIVHERLRMISEEAGIPLFRVASLVAHERFLELQLKSLYLGLSDGARTNELRRSGEGAIGNEQIWQAYELSDEKASDMTDELKRSLESAGLTRSADRFNIVWLLDDFSGSGNTYIRFDKKSNRYKGKLKKIYDRLSKGDLIDKDHYEVYLLLYVATRQAMDHIEYWTERFTSENGYQPLRLKVLCPIESSAAVSRTWTQQLRALLLESNYYDNRAFDKHIAIGGTTDARLGFAGCALPLTLSHNTPNNSVYILWGPENLGFFGLFPRVSRHREF